MRRVIAVLAASAAVLTAAVVTPPTGAPASAAEQDVDQPNIILITTDDQSVADLEHMPYTRALLGGGGVTFNDTLSTYPLCCPARATILTGQHAHNHGVLSNTPPDGGYDAMRPLNSFSLPVWLRDVGYETTFTGKYLNSYGSDPTEIPDGWTNWKGASSGVYDYYGNQVNENGVVVDRTGQYQADITQRATEQAIIEGSASDTPFFIWQSDLAPHGACWPLETGGCAWRRPMVEPEDEESFTDLSLETRGDPGYNERVVVDKPRHIQSLPEISARVERQRTEWNRARIRSLQSVDRNVRDTVDLLTALGEIDDTLIIFTSDNGYLSGEHRHFGKVMPYENSLRVPMLMRGPGVPAGVEVDQTTALVDIAATIADASGATPLLEQDGRSLLDVVDGGRGYGAVGIEAGSVWGAAWDTMFYQGVRTPRYTYLEYPGTGELELYDRVADPYQLTNVAYRPTHRATRAALAVKLDQLRDCAGQACRTVGGKAPAPAPPQGPLHPDELGELGGTTRLVTVTAPRWLSSKGTAVAWQKRGRTWRAVRGPFPVQLGENGLSPDEGYRLRATTPSGLFRPTSGFGVRPSPGGDLRYRKVDADDRWVADPRSRRTYNVMQYGEPANPDWRPRFEEVFAETGRSFAHALVLDHNLPGGIYTRAGGQRFARNPADTAQGSFLVHTGRRVGKHGWASGPTADLAWLTRWSDRRTTFAVGTLTYLRQNY